MKTSVRIVKFSFGYTKPKYDTVNVNLQSRYLYNLYIVRLGGHSFCQLLDVISLWFKGSFKPNEKGHAKRWIRWPITGFYLAVVFKWGGVSKTNFPEISFPGAVTDPLCTPPVGTILVYRDSVYVPLHRALYLECCFLWWQVCFYCSNLQLLMSLAK